LLIYRLTYAVNNEELHKAAALIKHNPICSAGVKVSGASSLCFSHSRFRISAVLKWNKITSWKLQLPGYNPHDTYLVNGRQISSPESGKMSHHPWGWEHDQRWGICSLGQRSGCRCVWPPLSIQKWKIYSQPIAVMNKMCIFLQIRTYQDHLCWDSSSSTEQCLNLKFKKGETDHLLSTCIHFSKHWYQDKITTVDYNSVHVRSVKLNLHEHHLNHVQHNVLVPNKLLVNRASGHPFRAAHCSKCV